MSYSLHMIVTTPVSFPNLHLVHCFPHNIEVNEMGIRVMQQNIKQLLPFIGLAFFTVFGFFWVMSAGKPLPYQLAPRSQLPSYLQGADTKTVDAYRFAVANHHELEKYPCTCGCKALQHMNNADCYIKALAPDGTVTTFDQHASGCGVCVDITQDVMRMMREGHKPIEIRAYIDANYSQYGPSTDTPLPSA